MGKFEELTAQTIEALKGKKETLAREIFELQSELSVARKLEQPHLLKGKKRERARVMTAISQKRNG